MIAETRSTQCYRDRVHKKSEVVLEMQCLGVHEATIRWISSFLTDRIQRVKIEGVY